jgi:hypothetical protein
VKALRHEDIWERGDKAPCICDFGIKMTMSGQLHAWLLTSQEKGRGKQLENVL